MKRILTALLLLSVLTSAAAADERAITARDLGALKWRAIGPTNMGGRATAIAINSAERLTILPTLTSRRSRPSA